MQRRGKCGSPVRFTMKKTSCLLPFLCALASVIGLTNGALYTDADDLPKAVYDFVIVGGMCALILLVLVLNFGLAGAAGNVLARRLTENSTYSVLVIEAGVTFVFPSLTQQRMWY